MDSDSTLDTSIESVLLDEYVITRNDLRNQKDDMEDDEEFEDVVNSKVKKYYLIMILNNEFSVAHIFNKFIQKIFFFHLIGSNYSRC